MTACWMIWFNRNQCHHRRTCSTPASVALSSIKKVEEVKFVILKERVPKPSTNQAEILAIMFGLELALNYGFTKLVVESDSSQAIVELAKKWDTYGNAVVWLWIL